MNGKIVICGNSIAEVERDLEVIKKLVANGTMSAVGGCIDSPTEDRYEEGYADGYSEGRYDGVEEVKERIAELLDL